MLLGAASAVGFGLAPALHATRADVIAALKRADAQPASRFPLRGILLAVQVAVSVVVLIGAGLLVRRVQQQSTVDPGIRVAEIGVVTISSPDGPIDGIRRYGLVTQLTQSLRQLPIGDFGFTTLQPFTSAGSPTEMRLPGEQATQGAPGAVCRSVARVFPSDGNSADCGTRRRCERRLSSGRTDQRIDGAPILAARERARQGIRHRSRGLRRGHRDRWRSVLRTATCGTSVLPAVQCIDPQRHEVHRTQRPGRGGRGGVRCRS